MKKRKGTLTYGPNDARRVVWANSHATARVLVGLGGADDVVVVAGGGRGGSDGGGSGCDER